MIQSAKGYRFSMDAVLLSQFVTIRPGDSVVDLGAGCGVIALMLLRTTGAARVICLEIQPALADRAFRNGVLNELEERMSVILGDIRHPPLAPSIADVVVCNPPYRAPRSGKTNPHPEKAIARHEIMASLNDVLCAASRVIKPRGRITMVYPAVRLAELLVKMRSFDFEPKKMRINYPHMGGEAKLVFIEAIRGGKAGLRILPPLLEQGGDSISTSS